jgi:hypothetical protein
VGKVLLPLHLVQGREHLEERVHSILSSVQGGNGTYIEEGFWTYIICIALLALYAILYSSAILSLISVFPSRAHRHD